MKQAHRLIVPLLGTLTLAACGGGGSSSPAPVATYSISGTLSGLTASSGVVLQDNGGNDLTVSSNGSFTFSESVNSGAAYAVTVATQPSGETCSVANGASTASANVTSVAVSCASVFANNTTNVTAVSVGTSPADVTQSDFNVPTVTVTVCDPTSKCAPIQVLVDTGSSGLRLMSSALASAGLNLLPEADPNHVGNDLYECAYYADGFAFGGVYTATQIKIASETATNVPVQVIDTGAPTVPSSCASSSPGGNNPLNSPNAFGADGVLGVGIAAQDCGTACVNGALYYYSCTTSGCASGTTATTVPLADQLTNPVVDFATDKNGVILQLPTIPASGAATETGYLAFGVGTETDNGLASATVLPITATGSSGGPDDQQPAYISTSFNGESPAPEGIIDSGSNAYFFSDSALTTCTDFTSFYCPSSTTSLTATNSGGGNMSTVDFQIANLDTLHSANPTFYAFNDVGGPFPEVNGINYFDFGLPFFYGRTVYTIIEGTSVGTTAFANGAFAY